MCVNISLCKYFTVKDKRTHPTGLLSLSLLSSVAANGKITQVMNSEKEKTMKNCKGGEYVKYPPDLRLISEVCCST